MKNTGRMKRFRNIVRELIDDEDFDIRRPRGMFLKAFIIFKKTEGLSGHTFTEKEHQELRELFVGTLRKEGIKMKEGALDTGTPIEERPRERSREPSSIVTPNMVRGAQGVDLHHHRVLGSDY